MIPRVLTVQPRMVAQAPLPDRLHRMYARVMVDGTVWAAAEASLRSQTDRFGMHRTRLGQYC